MFFTLMLMIVGVKRRNSRQHVAPIASGNEWNKIRESSVLKDDRWKDLNQKQRIRLSKMIMPINGLWPLNINEDKQIKKLNQMARLNCWTKKKTNASNILIVRAEEICRWKKQSSSTRCDRWINWAVWSIETRRTKLWMIIRNWCAKRNYSWVTFV